MTDYNNTFEDRSEFAPADEVGRLVFAAMKHLVTSPNVSLYLADAAVAEACNEAGRLRDEAAPKSVLVEAHGNVAYANYVRRRIERTIRQRSPHLPALKQSNRKNHILGVASEAVTYH